MRIVEVYVGSEGEAMLYREHMRCLGALGAVVRIVQDPWLKLPAVRTERDLYQGETNVGRVLGALSKAETELPLKINRGIPLATQQRFDVLIAKRQAHTLTVEEHQQLIQITEQIEQLDAERLQCLIELAALRNVSLDEIVQQLGIKPVPHA